MSAGDRERIRADLRAQVRPGVVRSKTRSSGGRFYFSIDCPGCGAKVVRDNPDAAECLDLWRKHEGERHPGMTEVRQGRNGTLRVP
jgi:hypothetical protein